MLAEREMEQLPECLRDRSAQRSDASEQVRDNGESASAHVPFLTSPLGILCTREPPRTRRTCFRVSALLSSMAPAADPALRRNGTMGAPYLDCL